MDKKYKFEVVRETPGFKPLVLVFDDTKI